MNDNYFIFRQATHSDVENLLNLLHILFDFENITFQEYKHRKALKMILNAKQTCIMVAEIHQKIVGMCAAQLFISTAEGGYAAFVEDIVVEPGYRKRGIAKKLLQRMEQWAKKENVYRLQLLVNKNNAPAKKLYHLLNYSSTPCEFMKKNLVDKT
ncbi:N-acetyltransferase GCN5 [Candidatus Magnetomorum sp. HK-1]|nr:N-acetyltransferase GCN5 [Candidatus Magnetomorum sp. HK-1]